jgi:hypothetical protein
MHVTVRRRVPILVACACLVVLVAAAVIAWRGVGQFGSIRGAAPAASSGLDGAVAVGTGLGGGIDASSADLGDSGRGPAAGLSVPGAAGATGANTGGGSGGGSYGAAGSGSAGPGAGGISATGDVAGGTQGADAGSSGGSESAGATSAGGTPAGGVSTGDGTPPAPSTGGAPVADTTTSGGGRPWNGGDPRQGQGADPVAAGPGIGPVAQGTVTPELPSGILLALGLVPLLAALAWARRRHTLDSE